MRDGDDSGVGRHGAEACSSARFSGAVAIVTGAAQGIGAAVAHGFVAGGGKVVLADVRVDAAAERARALGADAVPFQLDVTDEQGWTDAVALAVSSFGGISHLFNVAGISEAADIEAASPAHWARIMAINLTGPYLGCRAVIPAMLASKAAACAIVNVGSMLALRPAAGFAAYSASKAGLAALTQSVALHCAQRGYPIRVNVVHPGGTRTPMVEQVLDTMSGDREANARRFAQKLPMQRLGLPDEVADAILFLASDAAAFITATGLSVDGGGASRE